MTEKNYFLNIYNTMTGEFELVQVTKEVFQTYRRTKWHIEDSTERFYKHETQMSSLIGGENDGYELNTPPSDGHFDRTGQTA